MNHMARRTVDLAHIRLLVKRDSLYWRSWPQCIHWPPVLLLLLKQGCYLISFEMSGLELS